MGQATNSKTAPREERPQAFCPSIKGLTPWSTCLDKSTSLGFQEISEPCCGRSATATKGAASQISAVGTLSQLVLAQAYNHPHSGMCVAYGNTGPASKSSLSTNLMVKLVKYALELDLVRIRYCGSSCDENLTQHNAATPAGRCRPAHGAPPCAMVWQALGFGGERWMSKGGVG